MIGVGAIPIFVAIISKPDTILNHPLGFAICKSFGLTTPRLLIIWGAITLIGIYAVKNLYIVLVNYLQLRVIKNIHVNLCNRLFSCYMYAPLSFHLHRNTAELQRNICWEIEIICNCVLVPMIEMVMTVFMAIGVTITLLIVEPFISLLTLTILSLAGGGYISIFQKRTHLYGDDAQQQREKMLEIIQQGFGTLKQARLSQNENFFIQQLKNSAQRMAKAQRFQMLIGQANTYYLESLAIAVLLLLAIYFAIVGRSLDTLAPIITLFAAALVRLKAIISKLISGTTQLAYRIVAVNPVYDDLVFLEQFVKSAQLTTPSERPFNEKIELHSLYYQYPDANNYALEDISINITKGSMIGILGASGAGKTTLIDVIVGLLSPTLGSVLVDGVDIKNDLRGWQANISYVPQNIYLIDDTIRNNIILGKNKELINEEHLYESIRIAQLDDFIASLPQRVETTVGENGVRISGGQRQRIGLARALYCDANVLVLDEGTSALDSETEKDLVAAIQPMKGQRTIFMITHRISLLKDCDCLFFLENGKLRSSGSYEQLLLNDAQFRQLIAH